jgi:hypothetical protein
MSPLGLPWIQGLVVSARQSRSSTVSWRRLLRFGARVHSRRVQSWSLDKRVHGETFGQDSAW